MRGLTHIPSDAERLEVYEKLQYGSTEISVVELSLWIQWTRFDPRLAEILVGYLARKWEEIPFVQLNREILEGPWPATLGVLCEFIAISLVSAESSSLGAFRVWKQGVVRGIGKASAEQYFIGLRKIAGGEMFRDATLSYLPYSKWGYLAREVLIPKFRNDGRLTLMDKPVRMRVMKELVSTRTRFRLEDYRAACGGWIGIRQAQRDLSEASFVRERGRTKGRFYGAA